MALHDELLELSFALSGSTKQAYRRRSVSSAYYALFHRLAFESSSLFFPLPSDVLLHAATTRALDHKTMSNVCQGFAGLSVLKGQIQQLLGSTEIPEDLRSVSRLFFELQVARHRADYDIRAVFTPTEAKKYCLGTKRAFTELDRCRAEPVYRLFLGCLLFASSWRS
jgi:hypothetical protein